MPYFFTKTLEEAGHPVVRVNIGPNRYVQKAYNILLKVYLRLRGRKLVHEYFRTWVFQRRTQRKLERAMRRNPDHVQVFLTYSFGANSLGIPYVLFGDMTLHRHIRYFAERSATGLERGNVLRETNNLRGSSLIVALFPALAAELTAHFGEKVRYYGNVVNLDPPKLDPEAILQRKLSSFELVFIGKPRYSMGLNILLDALAILEQDLSTPIQLHVIGMNAGDVHRPLPANVQFHGYLDKQDPAQYEQYMDLLLRARLFVNPHPKWASFSASCEAMYLHTPVMLHPYTEFASTFGERPRMGYYLRTDSADELAHRIREAAADPAEWREKAMHAHELVKYFTWSNYIARFLDDLSVLPPGRAVHASRSTETELVS